MAKAVLTPSDVSQPTGSGNILTRSRDFVNDVRSEMRKVVYPSRDEVRSTTVVVIVSVFLFAASFFAVDSILGAALKALIHALGGTQ